MKIEIDDDVADAILVGHLANSYVSLKQSLKTPQVWHEDDVEFWKEKLLPAIEIVGGWYSVDFNAAIKKAKKKQ